jgi:hypothetical protein
VDVASADEVKALVGKLALTEGGFMTFELTPVGPLAPLARLIQNK